MWMYFFSIGRDGNFSSNLIWKSSRSVDLFSEGGLRGNIFNIFRKFFLENEFFVVYLCGKLNYLSNDTKMRSLYLNSKL